MKISVIIPTYNRNNILCETIKQVLSQNFSDLELIIVDQSKEHDIETTLFLSSVSDKIKYFILEKPNLPAARNYGIKKAEGDIVIFFDDDLTIPKETVSRMVKLYQKHDVKALAGLILAGGIPGEANLPAYLDSKKKAAKLMSQDIVEVKHFFGGFMSFKKEVFEKVGLFDEWLGTIPVAAGEDLEFSKRVLNSGFNLYVSPNIFVNHIGLSVLPGGCEKGNIPTNEIKTAQLKSNLYLNIKNQRYPGLLGWLNAVWKVYRGNLINRDLFRKSFKEIFQFHKKLFALLSPVTRVAISNRQNGSILKND